MKLTKLWEPEANNSLILFKQIPSLFTLLMQTNFGPTWIQPIPETLMVPLFFPSTSEHFQGS